MTADHPLPDLGTLLAQALRARRPAGDAALLTATLRTLCRERALGHVCLALDEWQRRAGDDGEAPFPAATAWAAALHATGLVDDGSADAEPAPLVLDGARRLYLRRDFTAERTIAAFLHRALASPPRRTAEQVREDLQHLGLAPPDDGSTDWQQVAIAAGARASLLVLTGGPGTGKTTTIARLLALLLRRERELRIALCAPTGKAASRLHQALQERARDDASLQAVAERCQPTTLHRLLGYLPLTDSFRASARAPLRTDLVVVDEASMADPALLAALCEALPPHARLWLVGDRDQLAAVAAGQVLGDVCHAAARARGVRPEFAAFVLAATGQRIAAATPAPAIADHVVQLQHSHRFGALPGVGAFAQALAQRDAERAFAALAAGHGDLTLAVDTADALAQIAERLLQQATATPETASAHLTALRILTATRHGPNGAPAWNARVEAFLRERGVRVDDPYYQGRPILVTQNDHQNHVYNGDLGIVVFDDRRQPQVAFPRGDGTLRYVAPRRLPAHETAWAMTVHKAQGSEFETVLLAMPEQPGPSWQAPLLYTGITRAKRRAILLAREDLLRPALGHWPTRSSGLTDALQN